MTAPARRARRIAIVDGGSFVLPYDHGLALGLAARGWGVTVFASRTRYNGEFLDALRGRAGVEVVDGAISGTVAPRWRGVLAYAGMLAILFRRRREFDAIDLQFSVLWPLELPLWWALRRRLVFTVHNAVPHDFAGRRHRPTAWIAALARRLVFVSAASGQDFVQRYGPEFEPKSTVLPLGLMPLAPGLPVMPYRPLRPVQALVFWSTVKPYKGVDLFADLARSALWAQQGVALEVYGRWDASLHPLREQLIALGVKVVDRFLDHDELAALLARPVLFALPYQSASQSGALYTLLHHGARFVCSDAGDLGDFMRRFALDDLLLRERSAAAMIDCLQRLQDTPDGLTDRFAAAQQQSRWDTALAQADAVFDAPESTR